MKHLRMLLAVGVLIMLAAGMAWSQEDPYPNVQWTDLFNGKDLTGWKQSETNGKATYEVKDGTIVGTTVPKTGNSFLQSNRIFGNFVLEYEFKVDETMNSGVQIRSWAWPEYNKGRYHGYQVEIDPSKRAWSAGIYDEGRRGWLFDLKNKPEAGAAFKHNDWNKVRVSFIGDHLQTWINGVAAADLHDSMTPAGHIALQVHGIGNDAKKVGEHVAWRNLRIKDLDRASRSRGPEGSWKGATSNASKGIYAKVEASGDGVTAKLFDTPEMTGAPLAELKGKTEGQATTLTGGDWSGQIQRGSFTGKGKAPELKVQGNKAVPTGKTIDISFQLMKGAYQPAQ